jgi:hypothetical protein
MGNMGIPSMIRGPAGPRSIADFGAGGQVAEQAE